MKRIAALWESYRRAVIPQDAGAVQIKESRRAFYAGAQSLFRMIVLQMEPGTEPTDADLRMMDEIDAELNAFPGEA